MKQVELIIQLKKLLNNKNRKKISKDISILMNSFEGNDKENIQKE